jgi:hypothetical protein
VAESASCGKGAGWEREGRGREEKSSFLLVLGGSCGYRVLGGVVV